MQGQDVIVRRLVPSDNSSLLNAVGYVMEQNKTKASDLRQVIATAVANDPEKYSEMREGAVELSILSEYYKREIAAYSIRTASRELYGEGQNYKERVMLIYDGLRYEALAMSPFLGAPDEVDQTIFRVNNGYIKYIERQALVLVMNLQRGLWSMHRQLGT